MIGANRSAEDWTRTAALVLTTAQLALRRKKDRVSRTISIELRTKSGLTAWRAYSEMALPIALRVGVKAADRV
jgi:hypothetical protein